MSYSQQLVEGDPTAWDAPPRYMVWVQEYDYKNMTTLKDGKVRHFTDLEKARKRIRDYAAWDWGTYHDAVNNVDRSNNRPWEEINADYKRLRAEARGVFKRRWILAEWDMETQAWVTLHEGDDGDVVKEHPLFKPKPRKPRVTKQAAALESIYEAMGVQPAKVQTPVRKKKPTQTEVIASIHESLERQIASQS